MVIVFKQKISKGGYSYVLISAEFYGDCKYAIVQSLNIRHILHLLRSISL